VTERKKDLLFLAALLAVLVMMFADILFTDKIVRAPDIINEFYWGVESFKKLSFLDLFKINLSSAGWNMFINSGFTNEGGISSTQFLLQQKLIFYLFPAPACVAWFMVFHLFFGAVGTYLYCRTIGASRQAAFIGGLIFAVAPENASLINAGHVMKIATISLAPWAFYFFEKGFQSRRLIFFLAAGLSLAFQFFHTHWQIAYYTCLGIAVYAAMRLAAQYVRERQSGAASVMRLIGLNVITLLFFLTTVAISLLPLTNWSMDSTRGAVSGANAGKGGIPAEEGMMWSLPPEELGTFIIPGFFGFSRQEAGKNPAGIASYYWGRMHFTQTTDYMGLLPWLLLPLPLIFRRDRYTWIALFAVAAGIIFSMGKYTFIYQFLFDHFPGINRFRVPKMMMFLPVLGLAVLSARGLDLLLNEKTRSTRAFKRYTFALAALPVLLLLLLGALTAGKPHLLQAFSDILSQPTRYEQGEYLVAQRWNNLVTETAFAVFIAALYCAALFACARKWISLRLVPLVLLVIYLGDVGRVNAKFMFAVDVPEKVKGFVTPAMTFLERESKSYRVLPMDGSDPMQYASHGIPVMFTSNPVQQQRWQNFLDAFSFSSSMPDLVNVKYLVYGTTQYAQDKDQLGEKYRPVFQSPDGAEIVLENRSALPKGWLVPAAAVVTDRGQVFGILRDPRFDPRQVALVETTPPIPLADPNLPQPAKTGDVAITRYDGEHISIAACPVQNALLVLGEKYYRGWRAAVDGQDAQIYPVDYILRGVYLTPGTHEVEFAFDPLPFKVGKWLTLASFLFFAAMLGREWTVRRKKRVRSEE
jgi:hypothetical protein